MVVVYSVMLALGFAALVVIVMGGTLAENLNREDRDPGARIGEGGRLLVGAVLGFGIGGMSAEFSPLDISWPVALAIAMVAGSVGAFWVRYATGNSA
ncbi:MAG TPA: hypothetical protein VMO52_10030 [Acidimicrobiia bacterium]|nr:hypothetical protein [Acidimicrobiia bacterium]